MDEPTVGIDQKSEASFYELMDSLNKGKNITLVMVTHDIGAISRKVNRVLCLSEGKLHEHGCLTGNGSDIFDEIYGTQGVAQIIHDH
jgi:zinc transport system ATP-binding protein